MKVKKVMMIINIITINFQNIFRFISQKIYKYIAMTIIEHNFAVRYIENLAGKYEDWPKLFENCLQISENWKLIFLE